MSALGEMFPSEKKSSRRRRKTLGKEDSGAEADTESRREASDGTRSSISGFRLITASSRTQPCLWRKRQALMLARKLKDDQGLSGSRGQRSSDVPEVTRVQLLSSHPNLCYHRPLSGLQPKDALNRAIRRPERLHTTSSSRFRRGVCPTRVLRRSLFRRRKRRD